MKKAPLALLLLVLTILAVVVGCGGGGDSGGVASAPGVTFNLSSAHLGLGQSLNLVAHVPGQADQIVSWSATNGTIVVTGPNTATYTAPNFAGTFYVTAKSEATGGTGTVTVVVSAVGITITPSAVKLAPGGATDFTTTISGGGSQATTFSANGGTITQTATNKAHYVAPSTPGIYTITAKSQADPSKVATATVTVGTVGTGATISGSVFQLSTTQGVQGVVVQFFDSSGNVVARLTTSASGAYRGNVPITARTFSLDPNSIDTSADYETFSYGSKQYTAVVSTCRAPLPALTAGGSFGLGPIYLFPTNGPPPPPPSGCG